MKSGLTQKILSLAMPAIMLSALLPTMAFATSAAETGDLEAALKNAIMEASSGDTIGIDITSDITLTGVITIPSNVNVNLFSSTGAVIGAAARNRHFNVLAGASLTIANITIDGNYNNFGNALYNPNNFPYGGIDNSGILTLNEGAVITNCYGATYGGGVYNVERSNGVININGGKITGNTAFYGGGICADSNGSVNMTAGSISGNYGTVEGGGIHSRFGQVNISGGDINNNGSWYGGGIWISYYSSLTIIGGEICGNNALQRGGGIYHRAFQGNSSINIIENTLISGNTAGYFGGGIYDEPHAGYPANYIVKIVGTIIANNNGGNVFSQSNCITFDAVLLTVSASVEQLKGNKNNLTVSIFIIEYSDGLKDIVTNEYAKTFSIDNNAADTYEVGGYKVYVNTKGNDQIRDCYIAE